MPKPITVRERVVCPAIYYTNPHGAVVPVLLNELPMDVLNRLLKTMGTEPVSFILGFITSHGRFVSEQDALHVAIQANQVERPRVPDRLSSLDLWPEYFNTQERR